MDVSKFFRVLVVGGAVAYLATAATALVSDRQVCPAGGR